MRVLLWNVGCRTRRGPIPEAIEWLESSRWDVAVLLEVDRPGLRRLERTGWRLVTGGEPSGRRLTAAIAARSPKLGLEAVEGPFFDAREGLYRHRIVAAEATTRSERLTIVGAHMPNSWERRNGRSVKNPAYKEDCFRALAAWCRQLPSTAGVVVAMDSNRGDWSHSTSPVKDWSSEVQTFCRTPMSAGLVDAWILGNPELQDPATAVRPSTYWTASGASHFFDRLFVGEDVIVRSCGALLDRASLGVLSDHRPVLADLGRL